MKMGNSCSNASPDDDPGPMFISPSRTVGKTLSKFGQTRKLECLKILNKTLCIMHMDKASWPKVLSMIQISKIVIK